MPGPLPATPRERSIVGVNKLAGQSAPPSISAPVLSAKGRALYDKIKNEDPTIIAPEGREFGWTDSSEQTK